MPRLARLDASGVLHHIMIRGIERRNTFGNNKDREDFLNRLANLLPETETLCYAWAFLFKADQRLFQNQYKSNLCQVENPPQGEKRFT